MKNNQATVQQLKEEGNEVTVEHGRVFTDGEVVQVMSFSEFAEFSKHAHYDRPLTLSNHGGYTKVTINTKDGKTLYGKYNVPTGHQFDRKVGLSRAIGRALRGLRQ